MNIVVNTMSQEIVFVLLADALLITHLLFVGFVVMGLAAIYLGLVLNWSWVRNAWWRALHLISIGIVVFQSWLGIVCPLTIWEMALREKAGVETYSDSFVQHWLQSILYYNAPEWVFVVVYTIFGGLVVGSWFIVRPNRFSRLR